jgi:hypothetical protein
MAGRDDQVFSGVGYSADLDVLIGGDGDDVSPTTSSWVSPTTRATAATADIVWGLCTQSNIRMTALLEVIDDIEAPSTMPHLLALQ